MYSKLLCWKNNKNGNMEPENKQDNLTINKNFNQLIKNTITKLQLYKMFSTVISIK